MYVCVCVCVCVCLCVRACVCVGYESIKTLPIKALELYCSAYKQDAQKHIVKYLGDSSTYRVKNK